MTTLNNATPTGSLDIVGSLILGETLSVRNSLADPDGNGTMSYQWLLDGMALEGETDATLLVTQQLLGRTLTVRASYIDLRGTPEAVTSAPASANMPASGSVTIIGEAKQNQTLTASNDLTDGDGMGFISYQWLADEAPIDGATDPTLVLTQAQVGKSISVVASYNDGHGYSESVASTGTLSVANVNDAPSGSVLISGAAIQGQTLTAYHTLTDLDGLGTISYQWQLDGADIAGAITSHLTLTQTQVGKSISVLASYTDGDGALESLASDGTAPVANLNDPPAGSVSIAGKLNLGHLLSAANTLSDADGLGTISYQWQADNVAIAGATASTLSLGSAQVGKAITVTASYTDLQGTPESLTSNASTPVSASGAAPSVLSFTPADGSSNAALGGTLTVTFDETIQRGTGSIKFKDASGAVVASYDAASSKLAVTGNTLSISLDKNLNIFSSYQLEIGAGVVKDAAGISLAAASTSNFSTQTLDSLYHFFVVAFDAAPGLEYMNQLADAYNHGLSVNQIVSIFTGKPQFTATYATTLTHQELATALVGNVVKDSATPEAKDEAIKDIVAALDFGLTRGQVIYNVFGNLSSKPLSDATWGGTVQQFQNETAVAKYFTEVMHNASTDLPTLRAVLSSVDQYTDVSTPEQIATLIGVELAHVAT